MFVDEVQSVPALFDAVQHFYDIVCRCPRPLEIHEQVTAIPWSCL